jgi:hypothetical protein
VLKTASLSFFDRSIVIDIGISEDRSGQYL